MTRMCGGGGRWAIIAAVLAAVSLAGCGGSSVNPSLNTAGVNTPPPVPAPNGGAGGQRPGGVVTGSVRQDVDRLVAAGQRGNTAYKIGPQDVLEISVFNVPELSKTIQVADEGSINLPLLGEVPVAGRTARQVEQVLTRELGAKYLQRPQVTVYIKEYNSQRVTVEGAVKRPGVYPIKGQLSLLQAIATAEGLTSKADTDVLVFRTVRGRRAAARFDIGQIRAGQSPDPKLAAGDVVVVKTSVMKEAFENVIKALPAARIFMLF